MKFVQVPQFGGAEVLTFVDQPTPAPAQGELLVEIKAAGVNYADIMVRGGFYPQVPIAPFSLGFELAGVVAAIGENVQGFKVGDNVAAINLAGGGYASHAIIPAATAVPLPPGFDPAVAVALLVQGITAHVLLKEAKVKAGDVVLISAAGGGLGNIAVQLAKACGARVVGLTSRSKLELVKQLGADFVANYEEPGWSATLKGQLGDGGIQVYLDSIGDLGSEAFSLLGTFGQWFIFGARNAFGNALPQQAVFGMLEKNIILRGFNLEGYLNQVPAALTALFTAVGNGSLKLEITRYPLRDVIKVHQLFETKQTNGKIVLIP